LSSRSPLSARVAQAAGNAAKSTLAAPATIRRAIGNTISDALDEALDLVRYATGTHKPAPTSHHLPARTGGRPRATAE
jgi:hypothetical protein